MTRLNDLTGKRFGSFIVLRRGNRREGTTNAFWDVRCDCGTEKTIVGRGLTKGLSRSCGKKECHSRARPVADRFYDFAIPEPNSGCLLWMGSCDRKGYGQLRDSKKQLRYATHIALELAGRPLPKGLSALHLCDNTFCVNADHLFSGTQQDNVSDMMKKGRQNHSGLAIGRRVKFPEEKEAAQQLYYEGKSPTEIAKKFSVSDVAVIGWMKEWGHQTRPMSLRQYCPAGHYYSEENTYIAPKHGDRQCRECKRIYDRRRRALK